jgi:hypothetical protein
VIEYRQVSAAEDSQGLEAVQLFVARLATTSSESSDGQVTQVGELDEESFIYNDQLAGYFNWW